MVQNSEKIKIYYTKQIHLPEKCWLKQMPEKYIFKQNNILKI